MPENFSAPDFAKRRDIASWPSLSTLIVKTPEAVKQEAVSAFLSTQTRTSGGSSETEETALAVSPAGCPCASRVVTTVTPVAKCPMTRRNSD